ncbi:MAG: hypothetical protein KGD64_13630 [Candidatus Heimdallarchaeota archaeon]|nr:hypothetical protein [Candidatus Heimdallarchaeota archaeon]
MSETLVIEEEIVCEECGQEALVETRSDIVCRNCGVVKDKIYYGTHFIERSTDSSRMGSPESRRGKSTYFRFYDAEAGMDRDRYRRMWNAEHSIYDAIQENKSRLLGILTRIGLTENQKNEIMFELNKIYSDAKRTNQKITNIFLIACALTIKYLKNKGHATSISDIVKIFKEHKCKLSAKAVRDYILENNISYKVSSAEEFIPKYMGKLRSNDDFRRKLEEIDPQDELKADKVLTTIEKLALKLSQIKSNGRKPSTFSVSCILLASNLVGQRFMGEELLTKEEISRVCKIPSTTLREHCRFLTSHLQLNI